MINGIIPGKKERSRWLWLTGALFLFAVPAVIAWNRNLEKKSADPLTAAEKTWLKTHPVIRLEPQSLFAGLEFQTGLVVVVVVILLIVAGVIAWNRELARQVRLRTGELERELAERKRIEEELERSRDGLEKRVEDRTRELAETVQALRLTQFAVDRSTDQAFWMTKDGHFFYVNDAACHALGYTRDELLTMSVTDIDPTCPPEMVVHYWQVLSENGADTFEACHRAKDGSVYPVEIRSNLLVFEGKEYNCCFVTDITERKRAEEALLLSQFCIDKAGIGIFQSDRNGTIFKVNDHACKSLGYSSEELCALNVFDIDPEITGEKMQELGEILGERGSVTHYSTHRRRDGTTFPVEITGNILHFHGKDYGISFVKDITDRRRAEEALRESEARLKMAMDLARLVQWEYDIDSGMFTFDDQFYALYGTTAEQEGGTLMSAQDYARKFVPPEESAVVAAGIAELLANSFNQVEHRIIRADGEERVIVARGEAVRDETGCIVKLRGANQDITERKRMEELQRKSEAAQRNLANELARKNNFLRTLIDAIPDLIFYKDCNRIYLGCNRAYEAFAGRSEKDLVGRTDRDVFSRDAADTFREMDQKILSTEESRRNEEWIVYPDGRRILLETLKTPFFDLNGDILGIVGVSRDITERKRSEEALQRAKEEWERTFASVPDLIAILDNQHRILRVNDAMANRLGLKSEECVGLHCYEAVHGLSKPPSFCPHSWTLTDGIEHIAEIHEERLGGDFLASTTPLKDDRGVMTGSVHIAYDITERKRAEEALRESESRVRRKLESILDPEGEIGVMDLADILDAPEIQALMEDLYRITGLKMSIIDLQGRVLVDVGWQNICSKFHRIHPETLKKCFESDSDLTVDIPQGKFKTYRCKNNMWHIVTPIIVGGRHMGNLFLGQFFFVDEELDYDLFRAQAITYGFPEEEYLAALEAVPRQSEEMVNLAKAVFLRLTDMFSKLSYANIKLAHSLAERERLTATLRQANMVVENSPVVLFRCKAAPGWPVEMVSRNVVQFGYAPEEFLSGELTFSSIVHPQDLRRLTTETEEYSAMGEGQLLQEYRIVTKEGDIRWIINETGYERNEEGEITCLEGIIVDVTEWKEAEEELREANLVVENSPVVLFRWKGDDEWPVELVSRNIIQFGYTPDELLSGSITYSEVIHPGDLERVTREVHEFCAEGADQFRLEYRIMTKGGNIRWVNEHTNVERDAAGGVKNFEGIVIDVTDRKLFEDELQRQKKLLQELNETLEQRVGEEVANNREKDIMLIQQNRQAALGELLDHIAHQWKQPLTSLSLVIQDLGDTALAGKLTDEHVKETVCITMALLEHMIQTMDVFRGFYRPDKEKKVFSIKDSIDQALTFISPSFMFYSIAVEIDVDPGLTVFGYSKEYTQVLLNILANARDVFSARGTEKPRVIIKAFADGTKSVVTVTDNAGGIPEAIIDKIFNFYFTTNESSGGTGIGLYMSKNIIEKNMAGKLSAQNVDGGAELRIEISPT